INGCVFPFIDNQNRTYNTCITTSDLLARRISWCRNIFGQPISFDYCAQKPCIYGICIPSSRWTFGNSYHHLYVIVQIVIQDVYMYTCLLSIKSCFSAPNIFQTTLNALEFLTTQTYQNLSTIFRNLVRNSINSSFNFLPLVFTIFRISQENYYQISADL
ncbi:unnamed protein product, partial [Rotaria sp. Silwood2]